MTVGVLREKCWCYQLMTGVRKQSCLKNHPLRCLQRPLFSGPEESFAVGLCDEDMLFVMDVWEQERRRELRLREDPLGVEFEVEVDVAVQRWRENSRCRRVGYFKPWWIHRRRRRNRRGVL